MIYKFAFLTGLVLTNTVFAIESDPTSDTLTIVAIKNQTEIFNVREIHDMGVSGFQEIDYVVNCSNKTMALAGFALIKAKKRLTSNESIPKSIPLSFYEPLIEHDKKIADSACNSQVTLNSSAFK